MSTTSNVEVLMLVATAISALAAVVSTVMGVRTARVAERRAQQAEARAIAAEARAEAAEARAAADEAADWDDQRFEAEIAEYVDEVRGLLTSEESKAAVHTEYPEAEVLPEERRLADAAIARGLLVHGTHPDLVALPRAAARPLGIFG